MVMNIAMIFIGLVIIGINIFTDEDGKKVHLSILWAVITILNIISLSVEKIMTAIELLK